MRNGNACNIPPIVVMIPVTNPRAVALPRFVSSPLSDNASDSAMLIAAPNAVASPDKCCVRTDQEGRGEHWSQRGQRAVDEA